MSFSKTVLNDWSNEFNLSRAKLYRVFILSIETRHGIHSVTLSFFDPLLVADLLNNLNQVKTDNSGMEAEILRLTAKMEHLRSVNLSLASSLAQLESLSGSVGTSNHTNGVSPPQMRSK